VDPLSRRRSTNSPRSDFLLYGLTGFTGDLVARLVAHRGLRPILSARNLEKVEKQTGELGFDYRVVDLSDAPSLRKAVDEVTAVLNCPVTFIHNPRPVIQACLEAGTYYPDITGEIPVFETVKC
jgi:short subunit dehydrogenase-like uncharacterized protein